MDEMEQDKWNNREFNLINYVDNYSNINTIAKLQVFLQSMVMILLINSLPMNKLQIKLF